MCRNQGTIYGGDNVLEVGIEAFVAKEDRGRPTVKLGHVYMLFIEGTV
jgi:hypothetical protein